MNKVLVIVDAQYDFTYGSLRNEDAIKALPTISEIEKYAEKNEFMIIYTRDCHEENYLETQEGKNLPVPHCIVGTDGRALCQEVLASKYYLENHLEKVFWLDKETFGSTEWEYFDQRNFRNVEEIWLCGFCTDICVSANFQIIKATYPEIPIVVIEDACAGVTPELHEAALKVMKSCQGKIVKWKDLKK